jgi:hypothetical protein
MQQQQQRQQLSPSSRRGSTFATATDNTAPTVLTNSSSSSDTLLSNAHSNSSNSSNKRVRSGNRRFAVTGALSRLVTESTLKQQEQKLAKLKVDYSAELDSISKAIALHEITTAESALLDLKLKDTTALSPKGSYRKAQLHALQQSSAITAGSAQAASVSSNDNTAAAAAAVDGDSGATAYLEEWLRSDAQSIKQIGHSVRTHEKEAQQRALQVEAQKQKRQAVEQVSSPTSTPRSARSAKHRATTIVTSSNADGANGGSKLLPTPPEVLLSLVDCTSNQ